MMNKANMQGRTIKCALPPALSRLAQTLFATVASSPRVESSDLGKVYCPATSAASCKNSLPAELAFLRRSWQNGGTGLPPFKFRP